MENLRYSIFIQASLDTVWDTMLGDATYRQWSATFYPGSYFEGDWSQGSEMRFLAKDTETGVVGGMLARVKENRPQAYISLEHFAEIRDGVATPSIPMGYENYTFTEKDGGTEVVVEMLNVPEAYAEMFNEMWPTALQNLKELTERG